MSEAVKITRLEVENLKRVKAVSLEPASDGLTIIGGRNGQGKTTVIDSIAWALGGDRYRPSSPAREGSVTPPNLHVELSNGIVVERKGDKSHLKVIDPTGNKGGQQLLNEFIETLALDLPKFMNANSKEKASTLLQIIGVGDRLYELESEEEQLYNRRHAIGQIADQKKKAAEEAESYPDAPDELVSASDLISQQQAILAKNGENQRLRTAVESHRARHARLEEELFQLSQRFEAKKVELAEAAANLEIAEKTAEELTDESTEELERNIADIDAINVKVRANQAKAVLDDEAAQYQGQYAELTERIEAIRRDKLALLDGADLPLPGLSVEGGELTYNGHKWDAMSGSEQLRVATAIVRKLNPDCGFVLLDKLEQMDLQTLSEFGAWLTEQGLQVIATRVSTGDECSIVIEDGMAVETGESTPSAWKRGEF